MKEKTKTTADILNRADAAEYLTISEMLLNRLDIPRIRLGRRVAYRKADIDAWLETHRETHTDKGEPA
jgi:predicted DNA-binding transcriptional regulator AlpA